MRHALDVDDRHAIFNADVAGMNHSTKSGNNSKFRQMRAQCIDQHRLLPDKQFPGPVQHENVLLSFTLDRHETHRRALHRFADRFCTSFASWPIFISLRAQ